MRKKDYELIANTLRYTRPVGDVLVDHWQYTCLSFADELQSDNPRFDRNKFLKACGVITGPTDEEMAEFKQITRSRRSND